MMSSGVITGKFDKEVMLNSKDTEGITFKEALEGSGYMGDIKNRMSSEKYSALVELHIEQGPVLELEKKDIGIVEGVCGVVNYEFSFVGQAGHAGTTPMKYRKDALYAATKVIQYIHNELDKLDSKLVYTTGRMIVSPNIHTIIPDNVKFTLDARHQDPAVVKQVVEIIIKYQMKLKNAKELGYSAIRIYSGPSHDAQFITDIIPTTMIFVPSIGGHSHCEIEYTPIDNCYKGTNVLLQTI